MSTRMLQRRGDAAEWTAADPILGDGEIGFERDTGEIKIGNGVKRWSQLSYPYPASAMIDAKGDLIVGSADDTPARLPRGTTGQHLAVNADGSLGWQTPYAATDKVAKAGDTMTGSLTLSAGNVTAPGFVSTGYSLFQSGVDLGSGVGVNASVRLGGDTGIYSKQHLLIQDVSQVGLTVKTKAGQVADTFRIVDSNSVVMASFNANGSLSLLRDGSIEIGRQDGIATTPFIDFHSNATVSDFDARIIASGGTGVAANGTLLVYAGDLVLDIGGTGNKRFRLASDSSRSYLQTDKPLVVTAPYSATPHQIFDILGDISSHGQYAGFSMYERTTDTNFFTWYTSGATLRLYSSTTGFNKFSIDSNGNILGDAANAIAIGWLNDPVLTGTALQTNPSTANNGALVAVGRSSSNKVFVVRGATGQVSDLEQWQKNDGTSLAEIDSGGGAHFPAAFIGARVSYGTLTVTPTATNMIGQVIRGVASQTAALQQWQDVTGLVLGEFKNNGVLALHGPGNGLTLYGRDNDTQDYVWYVNANIARLFSNTAAADRLSIDGNGSLVSAYTVNVYDTFSGLIGGAGTRMQLYAYHGIEVRGGRIAATIPAQVSGGGSSDASMYIYPATATQAGLVIRGVVSQSANMQEWQDNGGGLRAKLDNGGGLYAQAGIFAATNPPVYLGARLSAIASGPGEMALVLNAAASQTADIQQWRTSTGTVLAQVFAGGGLAAQSLTLLGATVTTATPSSGAAGSLPSFPAGYLSMTINGVVRKIPFYA